MTTSNFNLKGISPEIMSLLKQEAKEKHISVNSLLISIIEQNFGLSRKTKKTVYHDLDHLAGTWSNQESKAFKKTIKALESIDE